MSATWEGECRRCHGVIEVPVRGGVRAYPDQDTHVRCPHCGCWHFVDVDGAPDGAGVRLIRTYSSLGRGQLDPEVAAKLAEKELETKK